MVRMLTGAGALVGLLLMLGGGWVVYQEGSTYVSGGSNSMERVLASLETNAPPGVSMPSRRAALLDCRTVLATVDSLQMRYLPKPTLNRMVDHCSALAHGIAQGSPTDALAWFVVAQVAAVQEDWSVFDAALRRSRAEGPNEQWVAEMRASLAEDHFERLAPETLPGHEADLKLLVTSGIGIRSMARRYVIDPDFQDRIVALVETLPPLDQRRFATNVRLQSRSARQVGP